MDNKPNQPTNQDPPVAWPESYYARGDRPRVAEPAADPIIDLYSDLELKAPVSTDKEIEELKALAQSDALRAYGFVRRQFGAIRARLSGLRIIGRLFTRKGFQFGLASIAVLSVGWLTYQKILSPDQNTSAVMGLSSQITSFSPLTPGPDHQTTVATETHDKQLNVYSYQDQIQGKSVTVAQQALPQNVAQDLNGVEKLAISLSNNSPVDTINSSKGYAYLVNLLNGGQTLVLGFDTTLLFINSQEELERQSWIDYLNQLQ